MKGVVKKTPSGWIPDCPESQKIFEKTPLGSRAKLEFIETRNYDNLKRFFELRNHSFEMQDSFDDEEAWRKQLLILAGHFDLVIVPKPDWWDRALLYMNKHLGGPQKESLIERFEQALGVQYQAKSIAFDKMDEQEFRALFSRVVTAFLNAYSPNMTENEFMQILDFDL